MTLKNFLALTALSLAFGTVSAQTEEAALPRKVSNVEVLDLEGKPVTLPYWGEKNLMIFYVDPDHHKQNEDFTVELEKNHRAESDKIHGFGVMNLKDAPMVPNSMARSMARKRTATNGATARRSDTCPEYGVESGRLQQQVRADVRHQGGRVGLPAQRGAFGCRQGGLLRGVREL